MEKVAANRALGFDKAGSKSLPSPSRATETTEGCMRSSKAVTSSTNKALCGGNSLGETERLALPLLKHLQRFGLTEERDVPASWRNAAKELLDRVTAKQAEALIAWVIDSGFWSSRVRSLPYLLSKFDELWGQASRDGAIPPARRPGGGPSYERLRRNLLTAGFEAEAVEEHIARRRREYEATQPEEVT